MANQISDDRFKCAYDKLVDIDTLQPNPKNPNKHPDRQIEMLAKIIKYQGQRAPIVVSNRSGFITKGHGRLMALQKLGFDKVAVDYQDYADEAQEYADMIADNKIAELAEHDDKFMTDIILAEFPDIDLELLGLDDFTLEMPFEGKTDEDAVPDDAPARVQLGDVYQLGEHRLMCGDSTDRACVEYLMNGEKADMVFTDPPYGMNYSGRGENTSNKIMNDNIDPTKFYNPMPEVSERYIWGRVENYKHLSSEPRDTIIWKKNNFGMGRGYRGQYECCFYYGSFSGSDSDVWEHAKDQKYEHPTQKPVGLCERAIKNSNPESVIDLFGGSGSTLIACEKTKRKCFMMELDPHYCDVIIKRWEDFTGQQAKLVSSPGEKQPNHDTITKAEISL